MAYFVVTYKIPFIYAASSSYQILQVFYYIKYIVLISNTSAKVKNDIHKRNFTCCQENSEKILLITILY